MNGIIETATGDLLRWGETTFVLGTGEIAAPLPLPANPKRRYQEDETLMTRWNGSAYIEVAQPTPPKGDATFGTIDVDQVNVTPAGSVNTGVITSDQDVEVQTPGKGAIVKSPDGKQWRIKVDNLGVVSAEEI